MDPMGTQSDEICATCEAPRQTLRAFWWKSWIRHPHDTVISLFGSSALLGKAVGKPWKPPGMYLLVNHHVATIHMLGKLHFQAHPNPMLLVKYPIKNHIFHPINISFLNLTATEVPPSRSGALGQGDVLGPRGWSQYPAILAMALRWILIRNRRISETNQNWTCAVFHMWGWIKKMVCHGKFVYGI